MKVIFSFVFCLLAQDLILAGNFERSYESALSSDATYQAARAEFASAQQNAPMAQAGLLPTVSLSVSDAKVRGSRTLDNPIGEPATSPLNYRTPAQSLNIRAPLYNREASQKLAYAKAQVSYAEAVFAARKADLVDRLATAYFQRLVAEQVLLAARAQVDATQSRLDMAHRHLKLGEGTRPEVLDAEVALDLAKVLLTDARNQRDIASLSLRQITGLDQESLAAAPDGYAPQALESELPNSTKILSDLLEEANINNPGIAARRYAVSLAQIAVARGNAGHYPRLDLVASSTTSRNESLSTLNQSSSQRSWGLQLNMPIYSGGYVNASVVQALADVERAEAELVNEQQVVARDVTKLYLGVANGAAKIKAYQQAVKSAQLNLEGMRKGVSSGFNTKADVVADQRKLAQSQQELAQTVYDYLQTRIKLFVRTGTEPAKFVTYLDALLKSPLVPVP